MVDNVNPTSQFHPYQPQTATPHSDSIPSGGSFSGILGKLGFDPNKMGTLGESLKNIDVAKARRMARDNGGLVLGGLAALAIGAGLMRRRSKR
jgi:hypothetical protein